MPSGPEWPAGDGVPVQGEWRRLWTNGGMGWRGRSEIHGLPSFPYKGGKGFARINTQPPQQKNQGATGLRPV